MSKRTTWRRQYDEVQRQLTAANRSNAELLEQNAALGRLVMDGVQIRKLLHDEIKSLRESLRDARAAQTQSIRAVDMEPSQLLENAA